MAAAEEPRPPLSLWEQICADYEAEQPQHPDSIKPKKEPVPVIQAPLDDRILVPLSVDEGELALTEERVPSKPPSPLVPPLSPTQPSLKTLLLPGMTELLHQAKKEKCFERKRTKFIALDFLTEWLYNPRPPIPQSLLLSEEEAGIIIQSFWRGYRVRCELEVQELRQWQKHLRETKNITKRVQEFWVKQEKKVGAKIDDSVQPSPIQSNVSVLALTPVPTTQIREKEEEHLNLYWRCF